MKAEMLITVDSNLDQLSKKSTQEVQFIYRTQSSGMFSNINHTQPWGLLIESKLINLLVR